MLRLAAITAVAASVAACGASHGPSRSSAASPTAARSRPAGPAMSRSRPTVLVLTQTLGYHHASIPTAVATVRRLAARDGRYRIVLLPDATKLTPAALAHARAVMFLLTTGELPLTPADKRALVAFVHHGGGLIGFHSATDTFHHWPAYKAMMGAEFSHHPVPSTQRLTVEDTRTPATRSLPPSFTLHEEFYVFTHDPRPHVHVLVRLDTGRGGPDRPLVWCRHVGAGRVFYDALGHFSRTWGDPRQLALASGGISWAVGLVAAPGC